MSNDRAPIANRYDFVLLFDVADGNPNGDPDAGNMPRFDPETAQGLVTDVCLKRKVRNYVALAKDDRPPFEIYVKEGAVLNRLHERAYAETGVDKAAPKDKKIKAKTAEGENTVRRWMCDTFYDIRTFGAVMSTEVDAGQVRGPVQLTFARSVDPVFARDFAITRMAVTNEKDAEKERTIGRKFTVAYGLYRAHGFVSAKLADKTGFSQADLDLLWHALGDMFAHDRSAARGMMSTRGLYVFRHDSAMGNAPAERLFERVAVRRKDESRPARSFADYEVTVTRDGLPAGVTLLEPLAKAAVAAA